jgi:1-acyl-sn-glycerol-3-phosphate acyltransferase
MFLQTTIILYNLIVYPIISYATSYDDTLFYLSFCKLVTLISRVLGMKVFLYGDEYNCNEQSLLLCNHKSSYDIISIFYLSSYFHKVIGFCLKKQVTYIPGLGWWCNKMRFPSLDRNIKDVDVLKNVQLSFPIVIYPEGTRYSKKNYDKTREYAKENNYEISKYCQLPKSKGSFILSKKTKTIFHVTYIYLNKKGQIITENIVDYPSSIYIHMKKYNDFPEDEKDFKIWLQSVFKKTDEYYDTFEPINAIEMKPKMYNFDYIAFFLYFILNIWVLYFLAKLFY